MDCALFAVEVLRKESYRRYGTDNFLFGTILAFWCYIKSLTMISPVIVSLVACLEPSSAYFFSAVLLSETLAPVQLAGVVLVLLNVVILALGKNRA